MSDVSIYINPMKEIWPTRAYLCTTPRCLKTLRPPRDARRFLFHAWNMRIQQCLFQKFTSKKTLSVEKPSRDEAIKISPKQKSLKPILWMYY